MLSQVSVQVVDILTVTLSHFHSIKGRYQITHYKLLKKYMSNFTMIHNIFSFLHRQSKSFQVFLVQFCHQFIVPRHKSLNFLHSPGHNTHQFCPGLSDDDVLLNPDPASTCKPRSPWLPAPDKSLPAASPLNWLILSATMNLLSSGSARARSMRKSMK